ncbi:MAG: Ppx/GppA family phosphatase [Alphaproteobacteria bacterium]|nr:Ppx/GppA family phosphatase [Alphaproteobacteria bacterium]
MVRADGGEKSLPGSARRGRWRHTFAAVDLGTNNCRLLVARPRREGFTVTDAFSRTVRLGEGLSRSGRLSAAAMDRAIGALKICADKIRRARVSRIRAIATEACRIAENGAEFLARAEAETGIALEMISTAEEARLAARGCVPLIDRTLDHVLVFDIGGGSTELIWLEVATLPDGRTPLDAQPKIAGWASLPCGVVTLSERHAHAAGTPDAYRRMVEDVRGLLAEARARHVLPDASVVQSMHLLGTSGTVTTLAGLHLKLPRYERALIDGLWTDVDDLIAIARRLATMSCDERALEPCIGPDRADLVVAGCAILEAIHSVWPCARLRVADRGLREGILLGLMDEADREEGGRAPRRAASPLP